MNERERAQFKFVQEQLGEFRNKRHDIKRNDEEPAGVRVAQGIIKRWNAKGRKQVARREKAFHKDVMKIKEAIAFGKYQDALNLIKTCQRKVY